MSEEIKIAVIGLGYVGLPLAIEFAHKYSVVGFDLDSKRVQELCKSYDRTGEVDSDRLRNSTLTVSTAESCLVDTDIFIVTVPTPVNKAKQPDLTALEGASKIVARHLKRGAGVIYESTVYPGATEEVCVPVLSDISGLTLNDDYFVGYSPERINPGDKNHALTTITKVVSGSNPAATKKINDLYRSIIDAGTHIAPSIKVAEAAKVIENTQRDLNIALVNELSLIFSRLNIDTADVLSAARTKWNFLNFEPGLVGGHCIGVDPYYLTYKAQSVGYHPELILAGRRLNDQMATLVAADCIKKLVRNGLNVAGGSALIMGLTFKENCPDTRNSKIFDLVEELEGYQMQVRIFDPWVEPYLLDETYRQKMTNCPEKEEYELIVLAVKHKTFLDLGATQILKMGKARSVVYDLKGLFPGEKDFSRL